MATIITVFNDVGITTSSSVATRRCDKKCHEAKTMDCKCVCGGAFHGVGTRIAVEDRLTLTEDEIRENVKPGSRIFLKPEQMELFK